VRYKQPAKPKPIYLKRFDKQYWFFYILTTVAFVGLLLYLGFFVFSPSDRESEALAIDRQGNLYISDNYVGIVEKYTADGQRLLTLGGQEDSPRDGQFGKYSSPAGVAVDRQGNIYVADPKYNRIQKFDAQGRFLLKWSKENSDYNWIGRDVRLAVDSQNNVYLTDGVPPFIKKYDSQGQLLLSWGAKGEDDGQFSEAAGIALDTQDNVYVVDSGNSQVQKFDNQGHFLTKWGHGGRGPVYLSSPKEIAVDAQDNIYITNYYQMQKFNNQGRFLLSWDDTSSYTFKGIVTDKQLNLYMLDYKDNVGRIQKFDSQFHILTSWSMGFSRWLKVISLFLTVFSWMFVNAYLEEAHRRRLLSWRLW
jgi:DNA-binding beta-propeller fold protein YncE